MIRVQIFAGNSKVLIAEAVEEFLKSTEAMGLKVLTHSVSTTYGNGYNNNDGRHNWPRHWVEANMLEEDELYYKLVSQS